MSLLLLVNTLLLSFMQLFWLCWWEKCSCCCLFNTLRLNMFLFWLLLLVYLCWWNVVVLPFVVFVSYTFFGIFCYFGCCFVVLTNCCCCCKHFFSVLLYSIIVVIVDCSFHCRSASFRAVARCWVLLVLLLLL